MYRDICMKNMYRYTCINMNMWRLHTCDRLVHMCDLTHWYVWHDAFIFATWLIHMCDMTHSCMTLAYVWQTHSYVWHDSLIWVTWRIHTCDMKHLLIWHDSFTCVTWLIHTCDMTHLHVCHDSCHTCDKLMSHVCHDSPAHVEHANDWPHMNTCDMTLQNLSTTRLTHAHMHATQSVYIHT